MASLCFYQINRKGHYHLKLKWVPQGKGTHAKNMELAVCRAPHSGIVVASQYTVTSPSRGCGMEEKGKKKILTSSWQVCRWSGSRWSRSWREGWRCWARVADSAPPHVHLWRLGQWQGQRVQSFNSNIPVFLPHTPKKWSENLFAPSSFWVIWRGFKSCQNLPWFIK